MRSTDRSEGEDIINEANFYKTDFSKSGQNTEQNSPNEVDDLET